MPFALGAAAALWLYPRLSEPSVPFSSFVLFMGVAMSITAFPVLARILTERRLLQSKVGAITITCAAVDDVTAWCLLAFVVSLVRASNMAQAAWTTLFALLYIAAMLLVVRPFLARLGARVASKEGLTQNVVAGTAEAKRANLILLGWHKPLFSRTVLGGTVHEVMQGAGTDVAVLVGRGLKEIRRVLVPFIGSAHDRAALKLARRLPRQGVELTLLHVTPPGGRVESPAKTRVEELFPEEAGSVRFKVVAHASPEEAALEEARQGYDLLVVGVGAKWGLESHLFGLHRERIIEEAPASLVIVRHPEAEGSEATAPGEAVELRASGWVS